MKFIFFTVAFLAVLKGNAQNYLITFTGTGASTTVSTVKVENLANGESLILNGNETLYLKGNNGTTGIIDNSLSSGMKIYPNPMIENSTIEIFPPVSGNAIITIFDMTGKQITQIHSYLENSKQEFRLSGSGKGFYLIHVSGDNYKFSGKLLCIGNLNSRISIEKISSNIQDIDEEISKMNYKGSLSNIDMNYTTGDRLKFTGTSGDYSTVITGVPDKDMLITFDFIACKDGDNNNYPVVKIGTQTWTTENIKTTKYRDGTIIPLVTDGAIWYNNTLPAYCWYDNDEETNKNLYGALYNGFTVNTGNPYTVGRDSLCPAGWHIPTDEEWTKLTTHLGGESVAKAKMIETGTTHWFMPQITGTNETGFTALPGGFRNDYMSSPSYQVCDFRFIGDIGTWWSSTENEEYYPQSLRSLSIDDTNNPIYRITEKKSQGNSVRCIKD